MIDGTILDRDFQADRDFRAERTARKVCRTRNELRADVFDYIERFYNPHGRHSKPTTAARWSSKPAL
ncbi:hypothetical protein JC607_10395 [Paracoccus sp. IB05]|nr:hypothetical protein [Paracoccus sp. IB05]